ncbi:RNA-binding S4 domain-containing protein [Polycladidibacter stylochi]|uniref:RNA-binding S4 domain-containing protein n=1 Tax=Polycladidibacter stylochi TaxID=1807766 RepID=UPI00083348D7|nr:RNA-binding S4 domain-containing protein [Pseudovibrio stylochi]
MQASQRIDKWLWYARMAKTRTLAQKLAVSGHVRLNKDKVSAASQTVKPGDVLVVTKGNHQKILKVLQPGTRRGPAPEAQTLYEDLTPPPPEKPEAKAEQREPGAGRPTKRDRRQLLQLKRVKQFDTS